MKSRTGRTVGAAVGILFFVLFAATVAGRFAKPVSAAERTPGVATVTVP